MYKNRKGFTLVEILVGAGLLSLVMLGMTSMMNFSSRAVRSTTVSSDFNSLVTAIQGVLNNSTNCQTALGVFYLNPPPAAFPQSLPSSIKSGGGSGSVIVPNGPSGSYGSTLMVTNLEFGPASSVGGSTTQFLTSLHLVAKKMVGGGAVGSQSLSHEFPILVTIDPSSTPANKIVGCSGQSDTLWQKAANGVDIYYSNGNVGIGTSTPNAKLELSGEVLLNNNGGGLQTPSLAVAFVNNTADIAANNIAAICLAGHAGDCGNGFQVGTLGLETVIGGDIQFATRVGTWGNASSKMVITNSGNVGIGLYNPTYQLQLSTDSAAKPGTSTWTVASDARLKDIRAPFDRGLDALLGINPIYFRYKKNNPLDLPWDKEYVGIIAQDAQKTVPESVHTDEKGYLHVTDDAIIWTILNSVKELYHKVMDRFDAEDRSIASKADRATVDEKAAKLEAENAKLKQENFAIKSYLCGKDPGASICAY